eukprot:8248355-Alexandrium_andersonii.AAC.1
MAPLEVRELTPARQSALALRAAVAFLLGEVNAVVADGANYANAGDVSERPRAIGARGGLA